MFPTRKTSDFGRIPRTRGSLRGLAAAIAWACVATLSGPLVPVVAQAADDPAITAEPRKIIHDAADEIVSILAQKDLPKAVRISKIEDIAYGIFDFTTMSKLVLARNWRKLDKEQRAEFVREFKRHLSHTYGTRLDRYEQEEALGVINEISIFLRDWLTKHINGTDKMYSAYLTSKGVQ